MHQFDSPFFLSSLPPYHLDRCPDEAGDGSHHWLCANCCIDGDRILGIGLYGALLVHYGDISFERNGWNLSRCVASFRNQGKTGESTHNQKDFN
jgi:hypothetical protein